MDTSLISGICSGDAGAGAWGAVPSFREDDRWHKISTIMIVYSLQTINQIYVTEWRMIKKVYVLIMQE